jgi:hypothetical protein
MFERVVAHQNSLRIPNTNTQRGITWIPSRQMSAVLNIVSKRLAHGIVVDIRSTFQTAAHTVPAAVISAIRQ